MGYPEVVMQSLYKQSNMLIGRNILLPVKTSRTQMTHANRGVCNHEHKSAFCGEMFT